MQQVRITNLQFKVFQKMINFLCSKEISNELNISRSTVEKTKTIIYNKFKLKHGEGRFSAMLDLLIKNRSTDIFVGRHNSQDLKKFVLKMDKDLIENPSEK